MDDVTKAGHLGESRTRGRPFPQGNPGRKPGSKNKATLMGQALLKEAEEDLLRKAIEMAKAGDGPMLKFLLERVLPKERCIRIELPPMERPMDAVNVLNSISSALGAGEITASEAAVLENVVTGRARILAETELISRVDDLEKRQKEVQTVLEMLKTKR